MATTFNPLDYPIIFSDPERLTRIPSWHEHIPFAMFLINILRPGLFVELGTLYGDSYCAFCQAVQALRTGTRCYAVDTWEGDEHTSFQYTEALPDLRAHHDPRYGSFSTLIRSTFDEALEYFQDGTIDLLHIDGFHSYEAVRHDFETWRPKLSPTGIILFHDTNVLERGFGVRQFWDEIRNGRPHFEFVHGNGLGILAPGRVNSPELQAFFDATEEETTAIRSLFYTLGNRLTIKKRHEVLLDDCEKIQQEARAALSKTTALEKAAASAEHEAAALSAQLSYITKSNAWRLVSGLWRVRSFLSNTKQMTQAPVSAAATPNAHYLEESLDLTLQDVLPIMEDRILYRTKYWGLPALKNPNDFWVYQELIYEMKPDVIIEIGNYFGGSALALAHLCDLLNNGRVIALDLSHEHVLDVVRQHPRITMIEGDACETFDRVRQMLKPEDRVLVIEDSSHTYENTLRVIRTYSELIKPGDYLIVEDSNCHHGISIGPSPGPYEAIETFLAENQNFVSDRSKEDFLITWNPKGYLKRVK